MARPLIGITGQLEAAHWGDWVREAVLSPLTYTRAVERAGGTPVILPPVPPDSVTRLIAGLDGLVLTGGADVNPALYEAEPHEQADVPDRRRDRFELALVRAAIEAGVPVLAIGRGLHVLNVARGGTLIQYLPDSVGHSGHAADTAKMRKHTVTLSPDSMLGQLLGAQALVPALHHQAINQAGDGLVTVGWADDQVIEALELPGHRFAVGIQWHPEEGDDLRVFEALVAAATANAAAAAKPAPNAPNAPAGRGGRKRGANGKTAPAARYAVLQRWLVAADPVDLQPGHGRGPGPGHLEHAHHDQQGPADPGHQACVPSGVAEHPHAALERDRHDQERYAQAEAVDEGQERAPRRRPRGGGQGQHGGQGGADARRPAQPEHDAEQWRPGQPGPRPDRRAQHPAREREPVQQACEQQAEHDRDRAQHLGHAGLVVGQQGAAQTAGGRAIGREQGREAKDEQHRARDRPAPAGRSRWFGRRVVDHDAGRYDRAVGRRDRGRRRGSTRQPLGGAARIAPWASEPDIPVA